MTDKKKKPDFSNAIKWEQHDPLTVDIRQPDGTIATHTVSPFFADTERDADDVIPIPASLVGMSATDAAKVIAANDASKDARDE